MAEGGDIEDLEGELIRIKINITSTLMPEKDPIPAYRLKKLYSEDWGRQEIPYQKFGYPTLDAFLCFLKDVVEVRVIGGEKCYKGVPLESTKHIQQMVQRQKSKTKVKRRPVRGAISRGGYRGSSSYAVRGMSFAGPARTAPPHLSYAATTQHDGKQRILTLLRRAGGEAFYADIQRMYLEEYHRPLDQQEMRRLFGATGTAVRILEAQFPNEIHVTEPRQGHLFLKSRNFTAPTFGGASSIRGGSVGFSGARGGSVASQHPLNRAQPSATFGKFIPPRPPTNPSNVWNQPPAAAAGTSQAARAATSINNLPTLTVKISDSGANRQVTSPVAGTSNNSTDPIKPLRHSQIVTPSTQGFVAPRLPSLYTNSATPVVPSQSDRQNWPTTASSSSMSAMAQISNRTPTILKLLDQLVSMLAKRHPRGIPLAQMSEAYERDYELQLDTLAIYRKSWQDLITGQFRDRLVLDRDNVVHLSAKESSRLALPAGASSSAEGGVRGSHAQAQRTLATSIPNSNAAPPTRPSPSPLPPKLSLSPKPPSANSPNSSPNVAAAAPHTGPALPDNIRRLYDLASNEQDGLSIDRVAEIIGCPKPADALSTVVTKYSSYFAMKFGEGVCHVIVKRDVQPPPAASSAPAPAPAPVPVPSPQRAPRRFVNPTPADFVLPMQPVDFDLTLPFTNNEDADERMIEVQVSDYQSPMRFSLVLCDKVDRVTDLQRELAEFYATLALDECLLPAEELVVGRICAVEYEGNGDFHRAKIIDIDDDRKFAEVAYVDYGSRKKVPTNVICQLDRRFTDFPAQALLAGFSDIRPPRGQQDFSEELGVRMGELCNADDQSLWALVIEYDAHEEKMFVNLCARRNGTEEDLWLTDTLCSEGLLEVVEFQQTASGVAEEDDDETKALAQMLDDVDFNDDEDFEDELADDNASSHSAMSDYRRQLKTDPKFIETVRNMTRIYSAMRHQKLELMGKSTGEQLLALTEEIAKIERDLRSLNEMIVAHENELARNVSPPEDPSHAAK